MFITLLVAISLWVDGAAAQLVNGQFFTAGLAISDAPFPGSTFNVPSNLPISIDVSGSGRIPLPDDDFETEPTAFVSLNIFLVSAPLGLNATISVGRQLLTSEPTSTVKHLSWPIPDCLASGPYNLTFYEVSRVNSTEFFSITPIPIAINNPANPTPGPVTAPCPDVLPSFPISQKSSPPPFQPFLGPEFSATTRYAGPGAGSPAATPTIQTWTTITTVSSPSTTVTIAMSTVSNVKGLPTLVPVSGVGRTSAWTIFSSCFLASMVPLYLILVMLLGL